MFYQLNVTTAASTESVLAPTNASVSPDTPERHVIKVSSWGLENIGQTGYRIISFPADTWQLLAYFRYVLISANMYLLCFNKKHFS